MHSLRRFLGAHKEEEEHRHVEREHERVDAVIAIDSHIGDDARWERDEHDIAIRFLHALH